MEQQQQQRNGGSGAGFRAEGDPPVEFCEHCRVQLANSVMRQEHAFSRAHIERLKSAFAHLPRALLYNGNGLSSATGFAASPSTGLPHRLIASTCADGVGGQTLRPHGLTNQVIEREAAPMPPNNLLPSPSPSPSPTSRDDEPMDSKLDEPLSEPHQRQQQPHWDSADEQDAVEAEMVHQLEDDAKASDELSEAEQNEDLELVNDNDDGPMDFSDNASRHTSFSAAGLAS